MSEAERVMLTQVAESEGRSQSQTIARRALALRPEGPAARRAVRQALNHQDPRPYTIKLRVTEDNAQRIDMLRTRLEQRFKRSFSRSDVLRAALRLTETHATT